MGLMGFLDFVLKCIQLLAWPSFALGYPLCASIRAIETNSNFYMRKLVAYWIFFSLISLFEYTFSKLLEWVSVWPYVKILAVCWLAVPCFNGSSIAYNNIVRPCLSMQLPRNIVDMFNKKQYLSLTRESFLEEAERYIKENGTEALDKLLASKPIINEPPVAQKKINAVEILDKSAVDAENKPIINEPPVAQKKINAVEILDKSAADAENKLIINEPPVAQKEINAVEIQDKIAVDAENKAIINEPLVAQKDINAVEILDKSAADAENKDSSGHAMISGCSRRQKKRAEKQQPIINEPPVAQKEINAVEILDKSAADAENKAIINEPPVAQKDINAVEILDKISADTENKDSSGHAMISGCSRRRKKRAEKQQAIINEPPVAQKDINAVEILDKSAADAENKDSSGHAMISGCSRRQKKRAEKQQPIINEPPVAQKEINAVEILDKSAADAENKAIINEPPVAQKDINAVEILDKISADTENKDSSGHAMISGCSRRRKKRAEKQQAIINEPPVAQKDINAVEILDKSAADAENKVSL